MIGFFYFRYHNKKCSQSSGHNSKGNEFANLILSFPCTWLHSFVLESLFFYFLFLNLLGSINACCGIERNENISEEIIFISTAKTRFKHHILKEM